MFRTMSAVALQGEASQVLSETPWARWVFDFELTLVLLLPNFVWLPCFQTQLKSCVLDQQPLANG